MGDTLLVWLGPCVLNIQVRPIRDEYRSCPPGGLLTCPLHQVQLAHVRTQPLKRFEVEERDGGVFARLA